MPRTLVAVFCVLLTACSARPAFFTHDHRLDQSRMSRLQAITLINILPPSVELVHHHLLDDPVKLYRHENNLKQVLGSRLSSLINAGGFQGVLFNAVGKNEKYNVFRLIATSERLLAGTAMVPSGSDNPLPSIGPMASRLLPAGRADRSALMVVRYDGFYKSTGQRRKERVASALHSVLSLGKRGPKAPPRTNGSLSLALIDGLSGDVLLYSTGQASPARAPELLGRMVSTLLNVAKPGSEQ